MKTSRSKPALHVRNDILKLLYATMLVEFPAELVKEFWHDKPFRDRTTQLREAALLGHLWDESKCVDLAYLMSVLNSVEPFLVSHGIPTVEFVDKVILGLNKGSVVGPGILLNAVAPFLRLILSSKDVLHFANERMVPLVLRKIMPAIDCQMVKHEVRAGRGSSVLLLNFDRTFTKEMPPYDAYLFFARPLQLGPIRIGMRPFEEVRLLSDARKLGSIVDKDVLSYGKNAVWIGGKQSGVVTGFHEHCKRNGLSLRGFNVPDRRVVEITDSYTCPVRKREVLSRGCVYGAPLFLVEIVYSLKHRPHEHFLSPIINEGVSKTGQGWRKAAQRHALLMHELDRKIEFEFDRKQEVIRVNGRRLVKSAPALILADILRRHLATGKVKFENIDFTDGGISFDGAPTENFSLRLQRLSAVLAERFPEVRIERTGRGRFRFHSPSRVEMREV